MDDRTVTGRVLAVLEAVADLADHATLANITRRVGLPKPTVRRIAADLVARSLLERGNDGYRLGPRLVALGLRAAIRPGLRQAATPHLHELLARTGEIAWLSTVTGSTNVLIDSAFGANRAADMRQPWPTDIQGAGFRNSAAGLVLLAGRPDLAERLHGGPLPRVTPYSLTTTQRMLAAVAAVRDTGYAVEREQSHLGYACIAAGIRDAQQRVVAVIGVLGRSAFAAHRFARPLLAAVADIEGRSPSLAEHPARQ